MLKILIFFILRQQVIKLWFFSLFLFFSFTNLIFYIFSKELTSSGNLAIIATMFWIASSIHIANLYPSLLRDYFKAAIFLVNFIFIIYFLKNKIDKQKLFVVWFSLFVLCLSFIVRSDFKMLIPIYIYVLSFSLNYKLISKVKILMIFFITTLLFSYITSSINDGRSFQRFGAGLSNDMLN